MNRFVSQPRQQIVAVRKPKQDLRPLAKSVWYICIQGLRQKIIDPHTRISQKILKKNHNRAKYKQFEHDQNSNMDGQIARRVQWIIYVWRCFTMKHTCRKERAREQREHEHVKMMVCVDVKIKRCENVKRLYTHKRFSHMFFYRRFHTKM